MNFLGRTLLAIAGIVAISSSALAAPDTVTARDPNVLLKMAKEFGSANLEKDSDGDPAIRGRIQGTGYGIAFYGCTNGRNCQDVQFYACWADVKPSIQDVNAWNRDKRFGKVYLDRDLDLCLELPINLDFGVSYKNMEDNFKWWNMILKDVKDIFL